MARDIVAGEPGESWTNDTPKIRWQFICDLHNTCGLCIQHHMQVGPHWPIPLHHNCRCRQVAIRPGETADPFIDFRKLIDELPEDQRKKVVGKGALELIESGKVKWDDVVTRGRIRSLREVIARENLRTKDLVDAGFTKARAEVAMAAAHPEEVSNARRAARQIAAVLRGHGLTTEQIAGAAGAQLASKVIGVELIRPAPADLVPGPEPGEIVPEPPATNVKPPSVVARARAAFSRLADRFRSYLGL